MRKAKPERAMAGRNLRQGGSLTAGGVVLAIIGIWVVLYLITDRTGGIEPVLWPIAFGLLIWAVLLRPSLRIATDGVTLRNVVRDVHLPWPRIDLVETRWSLHLFTPEGEGHQSWAIAAQSPKRSSAWPGRGAAGGASGMSAAAGADSQDTESADPGLPRLKERGTSAARVGAAIRDGAESWPRRVARGDWPEQGEQVRVTPAASGIVALGLALALVVVALVI